MRPIRRTRVLVDYDGAQVFEGRDTIDCHYVGVMVESSRHFDRYLVAGVEPARLRLFRTGKLDLRTLFLEAGRDEWLVADSADGLATPIYPNRPNASDVRLEWLPDEGFVLSSEPEGEPVLREAGGLTNIDPEPRTSKEAGVPRTAERSRAENTDDYAVARVAHSEMRWIELAIAWRPRQERYLQSRWAGGKFTAGTGPQLLLLERVDNPDRPASIGELVVDSADSEESVAQSVGIGKSG